MLERRFLTRPHTRRLLPTLLAFLVTILVSGHTMAQNIRYVKAGGTGDGSSWANASGDLQSIINASASGDQVWVAAGEYQQSLRGSFSMKEGVKIYGGFAGREQTLEERSLRDNPTILRGNGNSVVYNNRNGLTPLAVLDGFTIVGGDGRGGGGGIYNSSASPTLSNLTISGNKASQGGGIYNMSANPTLTNVLVSGNQATREGGGIYSRDANITLINVTIAGNKAVSSGAAISHTMGTLSVRNSILHGNSSDSGESGLYNDKGNLDIANSLAQGHLATSHGNIPGSTDPLFTNPLSPGLNTGGDYSLQPLSPAVDAGSEEHLPSGLDSDLAGNPRIYRSTVDMGAYESIANVPLPVTLTQFHAQAAGSRTKLTWQTASELDSKEFIIYRSTDGRNFAEIGRAAAAGTTLIRQDYIFWDEAPALGANYYRLEQEDFDGTRERFSIRVVHYTQVPDRLVLSPNPTHGSINARFRSGKYSWAELLDLRGRVLQQVRIGHGTGHLYLDMQPYATGTYILKLTGEEGTITGKILKW